MPIDFDAEQLRCVTALSRNGVEFLVVGGYAVRYYGHMRPTKDLDVLVRNDEENSVRLVAAMMEILGTAHPNLTPDQFVDRKRQVNFEQWGPKFEVLSAAEGVDFPQAYARHASAAVGALRVPVIAKEDLIVMKKNAGRAQDLRDVAELEGP